MSAGILCSLEVVTDWDQELVSAITINNGLYTQDASHMIIVNFNVRIYSREVHANSSQLEKIHVDVST